VSNTPRKRRFNAGDVVANTKDESPRSLHWEDLVSSLSLGGGRRLRRRGQDPSPGQVVSPRDRRRAKEQL